MKVSDIMQRSVINIDEDTPVKEVARIIFSLGFGGIPVLRGSKLVGIITEQDILHKMYPTIEELVEDYVHVSNFEQMEKNIGALMDMSTKNLMTKNVKTVTASTPLMEAQSIMLNNEFSRLPVVDEDDNLVGIISQGDIFRHILKEEIPNLERERYASFIAEHYDAMVNWEKRFEYELPILGRIFRKEKVSSILDLGVWTGEYTLGLAKTGKFTIVGFDHNKSMIDMAKKKKERLADASRKNVEFVLSDFTDIQSALNSKFDAVISMGNALPYIPVPLNTLMKDVSGFLRPKNAVVVFQILNFEKILHTRSRLLSFIIKKQPKEAKEHLFIEFFDRRKRGWLTHNVLVFESLGESWIFKGTTSIPIRDIRMEEIDEVLKKNGFKHIVYSGNRGEYQGEYGQLSFKDPFMPLESDWLNVIAKR